MLNGDKDLYRTTDNESENKRQTNKKIKLKELVRTHKIPKNIIQFWPIRSHICGSTSACEAKSSVQCLFPLYNPTKIGMATHFNNTPSLLPPQSH